MQTLDANIEAQITKNARQLAQAETARALRAGKFVDNAGEFDSAAVHIFEKCRREEIAAVQRRAFAVGKLPAGIAQDIRSLAKLPSIDDLKGCKGPPVIEGWGPVSVESSQRAAMRKQVAELLREALLP